MGSNLLFELRGPDGHVWRLYENGVAEGFPEGTVLMNLANAKMNAIRAGSDSKTGEARGFPQPTESQPDSSPWNPQY